MNPSTQREERLVWWLAKPRLTIFLSSLLLLPSVFPFLQQWVEKPSEFLSNTDYQTRQGLKLVSSFVDQNTTMIVAMTTTNLFSANSISLLRTIGDRLQSIPGVIDIKSLTHSVKPVREGFTFKMVPLIQSQSESELRSLKSFCLSHPLIRNVLVSSDAKSASISINLDRRFTNTLSRASFREKLEEVLEVGRSQGANFQVLSLSLVEDSIAAALKRDVWWIGPSLVLLVLALLGLILKTWISITLVLLILAYSTVFVPLVLAACSFNWNAFSLMLIPLLFAIQITLIMHVFGGLRRSLNLGNRGLNAVLHMLNEVSKPCLIASFTTCLGLLSFTSSEVPNVRDFGFMGSIGVVVVHWVVFVPGMSLLLLALSRGWLCECPPNRGPVGRSQIGFLTSLWHQSYPRWALLGVVLAVVGVLTSNREIPHFRGVDFLDEKNPTRLAVEWFDAHFGGVHVVQIAIDSGKAGGVREVAFLHYLDRVMEYANSNTNVTACYSLGQVLGMMNAIWESDAPGSFVFPKSSMLRTLFFAALDAGKFPFMRALESENSQRAYLIVRTRDLPAEPFVQTIQSIGQFADSIKPPGSTVETHSVVMDVLNAERQFYRSQSESLAMTFGFIFFALGVFWKSWRYPCYAMLICAVPIMVVLLLFVCLSIPLNSITILIPAMAVGIGVDNIAHLITSWQMMILKNSDRDLNASMDQCLEDVGPPIVASGAILAGVLFLLTLSSFPPVREFGLVSGLAMVAATFATLIYLPFILVHWTSSSRKADDLRHLPNTRGAAE